MKKLNKEFSLDEKELRELDGPEEVSSIFFIEDELSHISEIVIKPILAHQYDWISFDFSVEQISRFESWIDSYRPNSKKAKTEN